MKRLRRVVGLWLVAGGVLGVTGCSGENVRTDDGGGDSVTDEGEADQTGSSAPDDGDGDGDGDGNGTGNGDGDGGVDGDGDGTGDGDGHGDGDGDEDGDVCGDGQVTGDEECDDGNSADGDGCPSTCVCPTGTSSCDSYCADLTTDDLNCGMCGNVCGAMGEGFACLSGTCENFGRVWQGVTAPSAGNLGPTVNHTAEVSMNTSGDAMAVWVASDGVAGSLFASRYNFAADTWSAPVLLEGSDEVVAEPQVVFWDDGDALAVWTQLDGEHPSVFGARYDGALASWEAPTLLESEDWGPAARLDLARSATGDAVVVWEQYALLADDEIYLVPDVWAARFVAASGTWAPGVVLDTGIFFANHPQVGMDDMGNAVVVWSQTPSVIESVFVADFDVTTGIWSAPLAISSGTGDAQAPSVHVTGSGQAVVAWREEVAGHDSTFATTRSAAMGAWNAPTLLENDDTASVHDVRVVMTEGGDAVVAWVAGFPGVEQLVPPYPWNRAFSFDSASYTFSGATASDWAGASVASAGDVDGDGLADVVVGAPGLCGGGSTNLGSVYVMLSSDINAQTPGSQASNMDLSAASLTVEGEASFDCTGVSVASAGDVDGDGLDDLLVGAPNADTTVPSVGKTYLLLASDLNAQPAGAVISAADAAYTFVGEAEDDRSGHSVASAGDVDGDGRDDLLIGAPMDPTSMKGGVAYVMLASDIAAYNPGSIISLSDASVALKGESGGDQSGWSVASAGDVDGDGRADVLIGAPSRETPSAPGGESYLMLGASIAAQPSGSTLSLKMAAYSFAGENSGDLSGYSVASAGDVDGDGRSDVLIGAPGDNFNSFDPEADPARVYVMLGSEIMTQAPGSPGSSFDLVNASYVLWNSSHDGGSGYSVASAGDFDGDGRSDVLIGAPARFHWSGASFLVLASDLLRSPPGSAFDLGTNAHQRWISTTGDHAGAGVAGLHDVNGDGRPDLLIGIPGYDSGKAMLVLSTHAGEPLASRLDAGTGTWGVPSFLTPGNLGCADLYHVVADDAGNAIATFNCGAGNDNVAHYSFTSDAWWGQQDIGVYGSGLSINPGGDAVATGTSISDAQANVFR